MFALSAAALEVGIDVLHLPATLSWLLTTAGVAAVNFLALGCWVFRARHGTSSTAA